MPVLASLLVGRKQAGKVWHNAFMRSASRPQKKSVVSQLTFGAALVVLLIVGVLQNEWFRQSSEGEMDVSLHGLEISIRQTVNREAQRFEPLMAELDPVRKQVTAQKLTPKDLKWLWETYGPQGRIPDLIAWIGYTIPQRSEYLRIDENGQLDEGSLDSAPWQPHQSAQEVLKNTQIVVLRTAPSAGSPVLLVAVDIGAFVNRYVKPAVHEWVPDARFEVENHQPPVGGSFRSLHQSLWGPLATLLGGSTLPPSTWLFLPRAIDLPILRNDPLYAFTPNVRLLRWWKISFRLDHLPQFRNIERRLAWNWLGANLLLLAIAIAFTLLIRQITKMAELRQREREFVATVSHELRTPLTVIRSASDNFLQGIVPQEKQSRYGKLIHDQSLRLGRMIEQMLAFAQAEADPKASPVWVTIDWPSWYESIQLPLEELAAEQRVRLDWVTHWEQGQGSSDPEGLRLVLENLVVNALNHAYGRRDTVKAEQELPLIRVRLETTARHDFRVVVEDEGRGIARSDARKVFEPFYRDPISRNAQETGSGLGLFLAHRRVKLLGGTLTLESPYRREDGTKSSGCRFVADFPLGPARHHGG